MENSKKKPTAKLVGENGNIYNLINICYRALKDVGMENEAKEMRDKITKTAKSYNEALSILMDYCDVE
jgi:hypothetical protein